MLQLYESFKKGTTTVGVVCRDGVVLATDRRVTAGLYIAHKRGRKIYILDDNKAATIAGLVADAQMIMDFLKSQIALMKLSNRIPPSTKAIATLASNILFSSRYFPYIVQFIIAGVDEEGPKIYVLDWFGTLTEEKFVATGSGTPYAVGVLEAMLKKNPTISEALPTIAKAVKSAMERDPGSGEGIDIVVLSKEGVRELTDEEIAKLLE
ncbi:MAG: archaeal proteasome endopeptidase complex subunit beta [Candidatus Methanomethyliaceae archaeon]|nr:archaeal proteasome endopeptidase complex subunit beta [Candidatus Methanomethyliaceae archaeon]MDW7971011.1 archaeal proteasome endopeptidase complex subunit beta [Nitrososphaerota archaeon]